MDKNLETMIGNMPDKTGKSLDEWKVILSEKGFAKHGDAMNFLKKEMDVSHGFANTIILLHKADQEESVDLVAEQYKGKESLIPIYQALKDCIQNIGSDVKFVPKKSTVSVVRKRQFILIKPATKTRIDLGFKIKDFPTTPRMQSSGPFGTMCSHRVQLTKAEQIDGELTGWIKTAYFQSI